MENDGWLVVTYTDFYYKIYHKIDCKESAYEYAERILVRGDFFDKNGIRTFIPTSRIHKVKVFQQNRKDCNPTEVWTE